jgi:O-antigen ligase
MEGIQSLKSRIEAMANQIGLFALLAWTASLPFAQIQKTRFTSIFLFTLLGAFLLRFFLRFSFKTIPKKSRFICLIFCLLPILPLLDFFRWNSSKLGEEAILLRLPFLIVPFLVIQFQNEWKYNWRKLALLVMFGSFLFSLFLFGFQGIAKIFQASRTDVEMGIWYIMQRPYLGLFSGILFWASMGIFWPLKKGWGIISGLLFLGLQFLILSKFSLLANVICLLLFLYFSFAENPAFRKFLLIFFLAGGILFSYKVSEYQAFKEFFTSGNIDFKTLSKPYANSFNNRSILWRSSLDLLAKNQNWVFGLGTGNFQPALDLEVAKYNGYLPGQNLNPHNIFLYYGLQYGIPGLILVLLFFVAMGKEAIQNGKRHLFMICLFLFLCCQTEIFLDRELGIQIFIWVLVVLFWDQKPAKPAFEPSFFQR